MTALYTSRARAVGTIANIIVDTDWSLGGAAHERAGVSSREMRAGLLFGVPMTPVTVQILKRLARHGDHVYQQGGAPKG